MIDDLGWCAANAMRRGAPERFCKPRSVGLEARYLERARSDVSGEGRPGWSLAIRPRGRPKKEKNSAPSIHLQQHDGGNQAAPDIDAKARALGGSGSPLGVPFQRTSYDHQLACSSFAKRCTSDSMRRMASITGSWGGSHSTRRAR